LTVGETLRFAFETFGASETVGDSPEDYERILLGGKKKKGGGGGGGGGGGAKKKKGRRRRRP